MLTPVIMHVNCCEQGQSIEEICSKAVKFGFNGVEFRYKRFKFGYNESSIETSNEYLDRIAVASKKCGLEHILFGGGPILTNESNASVRSRQTKEYCDFLKSASKRFEISVCNLLSGTIFSEQFPRWQGDKQGSSAATPEQLSWLVESFKEIGEIAGEHNIQLAFETHPGRYHDNIDATMHLVNSIGLENIGVNLDYANMLAFGELPPLDEILNICKDKLFYVHIKNAYTIPLLKYHQFPCALEDGVINTRELVLKLKKINYKGPVAIEAAREGDREWFAKQDISYYKTLLKGKK